MIAEILDGTLYTKPIEGMRRYSALHLASILGRHFRRNESGPDPWVFLLKPELHLGNGPDILVPDLAGWHRERLAGLPHDAPWTTIAPDWVCELLLPSGVAIDRGLKMDIYLREQVRHVWLIDPLFIPATSPCAPNRSTRSSSHCNGCGSPDRLAAPTPQCVSLRYLMRCGVNASSPRRRFLSAS